MLTRVTLLVALLCVPLWAQSNDAVVRRVDDHYNHLSSLRARYVEQYSGMGMNKTETGTLLLKKPGKMRWSYDEPVGKVFVLDGKYAWFYTPGDAQAQRVPAKELDDLRSPLRFLLGHLELNKELDQLSFSGMPPWQPGDRVIEGIPKGPVEDAGWRKLWIEVSPAYEITRLVILSLDGSQNDIRFSGIRVNQGLPKGIFKEGVRGEG